MSATNIVKSKAIIQACGWRMAPSMHPDLYILSGGDNRPERQRSIDGVLYSFPDIPNIYIVENMYLASLVIEWSIHNMSSVNPYAWGNYSPLDICRDFVMGNRTKALDYIFTLIDSEWAV